MREGVGEEEEGRRLDIDEIRLEEKQGRDQIHDCTPNRRLV